MKIVLFLVLSVICLTRSTEVKDVATCRDDLLKLNNQNADFPKFAAEKNWANKYIPDVGENKDISSMSLSISEASDPPNSYLLHTIYQIKSYKENPKIDDTVYLDKNGDLVSSATSDGQPLYKYVMFLYKPEQLAFFYKCTTKTGITGTDHRYVVAHDELTSQQDKDVKTSDSNSGFKGSMMKL